MIASTVYPPRELSVSFTLVHDPPPITNVRAANGMEHGKNKKNGGIDQCQGKIELSLK